MKITTLAIFGLSFTMILTACNSRQEGTSTEASLRWTGMIAADGCGFFLNINGKEYKPVNEEVIPEDYQQQDTMQVNIRYETMEEPMEYACGMLPVRNFNAIKILEIKAL